MSSGVATSQLRQGTNIGSAGAPDSLTYHFLQAETKW